VWNQHKVVAEQSGMAKVFMVSVKRKLLLNDWMAMMNIMFRILPEQYRKSGMVF
jgi:hypothetical protein